MQYFLRSEFINLDRPLRESLYSFLRWPVSVPALDKFLVGFSGPSHHQKRLQTSGYLASLARVIYPPVSENLQKFCNLWEVKMRRFGRNWCDQTRVTVTLRVVDFR